MSRAMMETPGDTCLCICCVACNFKITSFLGHNVEFKTGHDQDRALQPHSGIHGPDCWALLECVDKLLFC